MTGKDERRLPGRHWFRLDDVPANVDWIGRKQGRLVKSEYGEWVPMNKGQKGGGKGKAMGL